MILSGKNIFFKWRNCGTRSEIMVIVSPAHWWISKNSSFGHNFGILHQSWTSEFAYISNVIIIILQYTKKLKWGRYHTFIPIWQQERVRRTKLVLFSSNKYDQSPKQISLLKFFRLDRNLTASSKKHSVLSIIFGFIEESPKIFKLSNSVQ